MMFEALSRDDLLEIHRASLDLLSTIGVIVKGDRARKTLLEAGCREKNGRFLFPSNLVEDALKNPVSITLYDRDGEGVLPLTDAVRSYSHNFGSVSVLLDHENDIIRGATVKDLEDSVRISDYLPHLDKVVPSLRPSDLPTEIVSVAMTIYAVKNTRKPLSLGTASEPWEVRFLAELADVLRGGLENYRRKPMGTVSISPVSPLTFPAGISESIVECATLGLPMTMLPCPGRGLTAPVTLAGGLVQQNAEELAFLTLVKLVNPHCPLVYACRLFSPNMRTGLVVGNDPDGGFAGACVAQIGRFYGLPTAVYGLDTAAAIPDVQAGYEKAINGLYPVLARATLISGMGLLNGGLLASLEQLVIDDEIYAMLTHRQGGVIVNEETTGMSVIAEVMNGGNFLAQEHTRDFIRKGELWIGGLGNDLGFEEWRAKGCPTIRQAAKAKVGEILASHRVPPLEEELEKELNSLLHAAEKFKIRK